MKSLGISIMIVLLIGCSSNRKMNKIISQLNCTKTIYITWDDSNDLSQIESVGTFKNDYASFTIGKRLNYKEIFIESIGELNKKHHTKFVLRDRPAFATDSIIQVKVKIDKIVWNKGFSKAIMDNHLIYQMRGQNISIMGKSKAQSYASARRSLLESFEHANLLFLLAACEN